jgi:hypothetical protein
MTRKTPRYLGQVLAIEPDIRGSAMRTLTDAHQVLGKPAMLEGISGEYTPHVDGGEELPREEQRVQVTVKEMIEATRDPLTAMFDITAARDFTNGCGRAVANVELGGEVIVKGAPVPYLLWLVKRLDDLRTFVQAMPTHSPSTIWDEVGEDRGVYQSLPVKTARAVQSHKVITVAAATDKHQAQAQIVAENVNVGTWTRVKFSGAMPVVRKEQILRRIASLRAAVEAARAEANRTEAEEPHIGARLWGYVFD